MQEDLTGVEPTPRTVGRTRHDEDNGAGGIDRIATDDHHWPDSSLFRAFCGVEASIVDLTPSHEVVPSASRRASQSAWAKASVRAWASVRYATSSAIAAKAASMAARCWAASSRCNALATNSLRLRACPAWTAWSTAVSRSAGKASVVRTVWVDIVGLLRYVMIKMMLSMMRQMMIVKVDQIG